MQTADHSDAETPGESHEKPGTESFIKELGRNVGKYLLRETGTTIKWTVGGSLMGAVALGASGSGSLE